MARTISKPMSFQVTCRSCMANVGFEKQEVFPSLSGETNFIICPECGRGIAVATIIEGKKVFTNNVSPLDQGV